MHYRVLLRLQYTVQQMNKYARNTHTVYLLDVEQCSRVRRHLPYARCIAKLVVEPAADAVYILVLDAHTEQVIQLLEQELCVDGAEIARTPLHALALLVKLVADIADNLLDDVLDRHHACRAAVLVHNDRKL